MKNIYTRLALALLFSLVAVAGRAQTYEDILYLHNDSMVRGVIIEEIPCKSLKLQVADGYIYEYKMSDILRIEKRDVPSYASIIRKRDHYPDYHTSFDVSYIPTIADNEIWAVTNSHGCQFNPYIFVGGGFGLAVMPEEVMSIKIGENSTTTRSSDQQFGAPVFAHFKATFLEDTKLTPFADVKIGYCFFDIEGYFYILSVGCRYDIGKGFGINLGVGYTLAGFEYGEVEYKGHTYDIYEHTNSLSLHVGVDF